MDLAALLAQLESSGLAEWLRGSLKAIPVIEAIHVMAIAVVFGTIFIVDLRLLGYPGNSRSFTRTSNELLRWTWGAFALAVTTGILLFVPNANTYFNNTPFLFKMGALVCAGLNMAVFHLVTARTVHQWDKDVPVIGAGRIAATVSIVIWTAVIFLGRWIGFTKGYDFGVPEDVDLNFDYLGTSVITLLDVLPKPV
jgi:hypothetical protein